MAFDASKFAFAQSFNSNIPRQHQYSTTDTAATVDTSGYFNDIADELSVGDVIYAAIDTDGTPAYGHFVVTSIASGVVDVADQDAIGGTDTD